MSKIKIKDAAAEQGMDAKALVALLHEMGINKTVGGSISSEEYEKVKVKKQEAAASARRDVVVRRRARPVAAEAAPAAQAPASTPAPAEKVTEKPEETSVAAVPAPAPEKETEKKDATPAVPESGEDAKAAPAAKPEKSRRSRSSKRAEIPAARVIRTATEENAAKTVEATPAVPVFKEEPKSEVKPEAQEASKTEAVREIPAEAVPAAPQVHAEEKVQAAAAEQTPKEAAKEIARPVAKSASRSEQSRRAPAASAEPEGSSKPSLLPPASERRRDGGSASADGPRVRVISRPEPAQARIVRPAAPSSSRDGEVRGREGGRRDNRDARPSRDGGTSRFNRDSRGEDKDSRDRDSRRPARSGGNRPSRSSGAPFAAPFGQQPPMENEQSRRKRNTKNRRTVDFSQESDGFRRHVDMLDDEGMVRPRHAHKPRKQQPQAAVQSTQPMKAAKRRIRMEESIRVSELAHQMGVKASEIIKVLFGLGVMATINNALDIDTATLVASEFGYEVEKVGFSEEEYLTSVSTPDAPEMLKPRPPVVTIMGHVDHGKTSLLDAIRKTSVTSGEAGGITQHIGAYHVKTKRGDIVFLDTPGHAAFTAMRARGAQVTDLVVLVVAADDGVMDQTREAINHARAAGVPILVAVNKIDKEAANPDRVLRELSELGLQPEDWGGDTVVGLVSAKTGKGLDDLLELIALQAEILELKANPDKPAHGRVVEAKLDKGRGPVATVLIQEGTIHQGDVFVCGVFSGRVRAMFNDQGRKIREAGPSMPVEVQGFEGVPEAGEEFVCLDDEKKARRIADARATRLREKELAKVSRVTLENFLKQSADTQETQVLNVVLKTDVQGSLEAITESLRKLGTEKVRIELIHGGAGAISESDVMLAAASNAIIIGFNVRPTAKVKEVAEQEQVDIRFYDIIYKLVEEIKSAMAGLLAPVSKEVYLGQAEVRKIFSLPKVGIIAGCMVTDGKLTRAAQARLLRDGVVVYTGRLASLKRGKDDAREVVNNFECGVGLENFQDIKEGDIIEAFNVVEEAASLD
ncbi:translation initiation factor IF-2 [uncultured Mailhella sp.]|uniref:translation initiation factor IF-2 n=1 Tax=uncultured Mailhella sp. TaxID=1981031 RepID=UPI00262CD254|nr:translation initiation factor IF-2 [uncultured Mailhella sp.]